MGKIDLTINKTGLQHNIKKARENNVIIPTIAQMQHPETVPEKIREKLGGVGLWDVNPLNLFRITWKNEAKETGGQVVPHGLPQGRRGVRLPCPASRHRSVRRDVPPRRLALHGQLLPRRRIQLEAAGGRFRCHSPRGDEQGAL